MQNALQSQKVFCRYFRKKGWKRFLKENILETGGSHRTKALSVALGIFIGLTPLWGFHTVLVLFFATCFRLNKVLSYMCTHISFPPFIPLIIMLSMMVGAHFVGGNTDLDHMAFTTLTIRENLLQYLVGSMVLAVSAAAVFGALTYILLKAFDSKQSRQTMAEQN